MTQTATFLNVSGTGIVSGNGFSPTEANWAFTVQNAGSTGPWFSFSANVSTQGQSVPDGGSAVAMLGIGLGVVEFIRRKFRLRS